MEKIKAPTWAIAAHNFEAEKDTKIGFQKGQILRVLDTSIGKGWWKGSVRESPEKIGLFPGSYVKEISEEEGAELYVAHTKYWNLSNPNDLKYQTGDRMYVVNVIDNQFFLGRLMNSAAYGRISRSTVDKVLFKVVALYPYNGEVAHSLKFQTGDVFYVTKEVKTWYQAVPEKGGAAGLIPQTYVTTDLSKGSSASTPMPSNTKISKDSSASTPMPSASMNSSSSSSSSQTLPTTLAQHKGITNESSEKIMSRAESSDPSSTSNSSLELGTTSHHQLERKKSIQQSTQYEEFVRQSEERIRQVEEKAQEWVRLAEAKWQERLRQVEENWSRKEEEWKRFVPERSEENTSSSTQLVTQLEEAEQQIRYLTEELQTQKESSAKVLEERGQWEQQIMLVVHNLQNDVEQTQQQAKQALEQTAQELQTLKSTFKQQTEIVQKQHTFISTLRTEVATLTENSKSLRNETNSLQQTVTEQVKGVKLDVSQLHNTLRNLQFDSNKIFEDVQQLTRRLKNFEDDLDESQLDWKQIIQKQKQ